MSDYKVTYFNSKGRAEISRLILAAAGQKFTDERVADWPKGKEDAPLGQMPYLTLDGFKLPQSIAIARFLAKKFNLYGSDDLEQAKTDAVVDTVSDLQNDFYKRVFSADTKDEERDAVQRAYVAENAAAQHLEKIEKLITLWGSNGHSVGSSLKWSDLAIWDFTFTLIGIDANILAKYPGILAVNKSVESNPKVAEYIKTRPVTPF